MSKSFETAGLKLSTYLMDRGDAAINKAAPKWFSETMGEDYPSMLAVFDPGDSSTESANLYRKSKEPYKPDTPVIDSDQLARVRLQVLFLSGMTQAARRRYAACASGRPRTSCDTFRYEKERKVTAAGLVFSAVQNLKDREEPV